MQKIVFDGRKFAAYKQAALAIRTFELGSRGIKPRLMSVLVGNDPASKLYVSLKEKKAREIRAELEVYEIGLRRDAQHIIRLIKYFSTKPDVHGIMVQLPLPKRLEDAKDDIINSIDPAKDVDGLRDDSPFVHPTSMAIIQIIQEAERKLKTKDKTVCVVGATGMVGKPLVKQLQKLGYSVTEANSKTKDLGSLVKKAKIVVSTTGVPNIIKGDMVKQGAIVIDVGAPEGDVDFKEVSQKASFITPVPGGVGPVTICCLLENLLEAAAKQPLQDEIK